MLAISEDEAFGRFIAAGRMLAGLDQGQLAALAGISGSTISNIERGQRVTEKSERAVRRALRAKGINLTFGNNQAIVAAAYVDRNAEDDD